MATQGKYFYQDASGNKTDIYTLINNDIGTVNVVNNLFENFPLGITPVKTIDKIKNGSTSGLGYVVNGSDISNNCATAWVTTYTATTSVTIPSWVNSIAFIAIGGGGGGGAGGYSNFDTNGSGGGGGGSGGILVSNAISLSSKSIHITIGSGGPGAIAQSGSRQNGTIGGNTTINVNGNLYTAGGGLGGEGGLLGLASGVGGTGGSVTNSPPVNSFITGTNGNRITFAPPIIGGGSGGSINNSSSYYPNIIYTGGTGGSNNGLPGSIGTGYGAGGGGGSGANKGSSIRGNGGNGVGGKVILYYYPQ